MKEFYDANKKIIHSLTVILFVIAVTYLIFRYLFTYIAPFFTALILSIILEPFIRFMTNRLKMQRWLASVISVVFILSLLVFIVTIIIVQITKQASQFIANFPSYAADLENAMIHINTLLARIVEFLPEDIRSSMDDVSAYLIGMLTNSLGSGVQERSVNMVTSIPSAFMYIIVTLLSTFFLCKDRFLIGSCMSKGLPPNWVKSYHMVKDHISGTILGYIKAQGILMSIVCVICLIALSILGSSYALLLSIIIAFIDALPVMGSGFILWPWAAFSAFQGEYVFAAGLIITYLVILLTRQMLEPKVLGQQIGVHPLLTLMSIYIGLKLYGFFGFFLGPLIMVIIKAFLTEIHQKSEYQ